MRQNTALRLSYSQARILLHRPFLLDTFKKELEVELRDGGVKEGLEGNVRECVDAALEVVKTIDAMARKIGAAFSASWVCLSFPLM
jgi:hypothetical protein